MQRVTIVLLLNLVLLPAAQAQAKNPFLGRWDFDLTGVEGFHASWMGVSEKDGKLEVLFQATEAHVAPVQTVTVNGSHMTVVVSAATERSPARILELTIANGKISGVQKRGNQTVSLAGVHAPDLKRRAPAAWTEPVSLFNGKNLDGWEPVDKSAEIHWTVKDGMLVNLEHGGNIKTTRNFDDFKLHYEVNCPDRANSGVFLRGRYEVQVAGGPGNAPAATTAAAGGRGGRGYNLPPNRSMGSIYGRLAPAAAVSTPADGWDVFDVRLVGRTVTVVRNGVTTIDHQEIEGITGGALDANEGEPGPFYIQGDHTGKVKFRNITVSIPKS
jgi:Domain of Unknown Function (DUF1080)